MCHTCDMLCVTGVTCYVSQVWHVMCHQCDMLCVTSVTCYVSHVWCYVSQVWCYDSPMWHVMCHQCDMLCVTSVTCYASMAWHVMCHRCDMLCVTGVTCYVSLAWHVMCHQCDTLCITGVTCYVSSVTCHHHVMCCKYSCGQCFTCGHLCPVHARVDVTTGQSAATGQCILWSVIWPPTGPVSLHWCGQAESHCSSYSDDQGQCTL